MISRRQFLKTIFSFFIASILAPFISKKHFANAVLAGSQPLLSVARGKNKAVILKEALAGLGGIEKFVQPGQRVVIKPNAAWARTPDEGANVHPELLKELINLCFSAKASAVTVVENTCDNARSALEVNGIKQAVKETRAILQILDDEKDFVSVDIPRGVTLKKALIPRAIQDADVFINMPIAKSHSAATLTLGMKNHMGAVHDRWFFHRNGLHQCIADISTVLRPDLIVVDATRLMLTNGPKGPGKLKIEDAVIAGVDQVAIDSYAATLFGYTGEKIPYIEHAYKLGLGEIDLSKVTIQERFFE